MLRTDIDSGRLASAIDGRPARRPWAPEVYRLLMEQAQTGIIVIQDGRIAYANPRAAQWTGYSADELCTRLTSAMDLVAPEFRAEVSERMRQGAAGAAAEDYDIQCLRRDGSRFDARVKGRWITIDGTQVDLVCFHDITELKESTRALQAQERLLNEAEALAGTGSMCWDLKSGTLTLSAGMWRLLGEQPNRARVDITWLLRHVPDTDHRVVLDVYERATSSLPADGVHRIVRTDGAVRMVLHKGVVDFGADGGPMRLRATIRDVTDQMLVQQRSYELEHLEMITGLPNRLMFCSRLNACIRRDSMQSGGPLAVVLLQVDRLDIVQEALGFEAGDAVLRAVAARLSEVATCADQIAHLGGGVFAAQVSDPAAFDETAVEQTATAWREAIEKPVATPGGQEAISLRIGIALYPTDGADANELVSRAHSALSQAQVSTGQYIAFFRPQANEQARRRLRDEAELRDAIERGDLLLLYQPQIRLRDIRMCGIECLLRWRHPVRGVIPPDEFIPLAEQSSLMLKVDDWVFRNACKQVASWSAQGLGLPCVSVNLSAHWLLQRDVVKRVQQLLVETKADPLLLGVEITEGVFMHNLEHVRRALTDLKALGLRILLDDFGTGYSSLSYLHSLPVDVIKIDQSFVENLSTSANSLSMTRAIINLAHGLNIEVLAEGVETEQQLALLSEHRCDEVQGFLFSRPVEAQELARMLQSGDDFASKVSPRPDSDRVLLLVDDEENITAALRRALRSEGYRIVTANSGSQGFERLAQNNVSVIVSDQRMPGMTGVEFLRKARELYPDTIRIVLSGYTELQSITDAINEGSIYKFLTKPWDDAQLKAQIAEAFHRRELARDNEKLAQELKNANRELADVNQKLKVLLTRQAHRLQRDEARLAATRELFECMPVPVIGIDNEGLVAFVNVAADKAVSSAFGLIGLPAKEALPSEWFASPLEESIQQPERTVFLGSETFTLRRCCLEGTDGPLGEILVLLP